MQIYSGVRGFNRRWIVCSAASIGLVPSALFSQGLVEVTLCELRYNSPGSTMQDVATLLNVEPIRFEEPFENNLILVLRDICGSLQINFAFGYFDDSEIPNACWFPGVLLRPLLPNEEALGTVLMGRALLRETLNSKNSGAAMTAFCAHEAGHALQSKYKLSAGSPSSGTSKIRDELCADFICGYYAGRRHKQDKEYPVAIQAVTEYRRGEKGPVPVTHGTPNLRALAISEGFKYWNQRPGDGFAAISAGTNFAFSIKL